MRFYRPNPLWLKISDYLCEVGSETSLDLFCSKVLKKIDCLFPLEHSAAFFCVKAPTVSYIREAIGVSAKDIDAYNQYYYSVSPTRYGAFKKVIPVDWLEFRHTEFVTDYMLPQGIAKSIRMYVFPPGAPPCILIINRPKRSSTFCDRRVKTVLEHIQPHLSNYYSIFCKMASASALKLSVEHFYVGGLARECMLLSKREAEVAVLLCQKLTMAEIASKLLLSPRTVETYVENIKEKLKVRNRQELVAKLIKTVTDSIDQ